MARITLRLARIGLVLASLFGTAGALQALPSQPADWCLRWSDNCTTCSRVNAGAEVNCATRPGACVAGPTRCLKAESTALRETCEKPKTLFEPCNACAKTANGLACTLKLCPVRDITCVTTRR